MLLVYTNGQEMQAYLLGTRTGPKTRGGAAGSLGLSAGLSTVDIDRSKAETL